MREPPDQAAALGQRDDVDAPFRRRVEERSSQPDPPETDDLPDAA
jgi:hypothetical protein